MYNSYCLSNSGQMIVNCGEQNGFASDDRFLCFHAGTMPAVE